jgi:hypothetical protein
MTRITSLLLGVPLAAAALLLSKAASAQDLAPPSTGSDASGATASGAPKSEGEKLDSDEKKDSGRGLEWFYVDGNAGFSYINMTSLSVSNLLPAAASGANSLPTQSTSSQGPVFGVGAGLRLFILSLGARASLNELSDFNLWQLDAELGLHIPIGHFEPYIMAHGGYCFVGSLSQGVADTASISIYGGDVGAKLGLDYYFNHFVSIGLDVSGSLLFLHRPPPALTATEVQVLKAAGEYSTYQQSGDSVGMGVAPSIHLGLHL